MPNVKVCLLVEDDPEDQEIFIDALHRISDNVGCYAVSNGEEALTTLQNDKFMPDFIFTDLNMPCLDGFGFLKKLRALEKFRSTPVIVFSSNYSEDVIHKAKQLGASAIYSKTRIHILSEILKRLLMETTGEDAHEKDREQTSE